MAINNYIIIFSKGIKAPLLAKDGVYKLKCESQMIPIPACVERWMVCQFFQAWRKTDGACWWIRTYFDSNISTADLDKCLANFEKDHPVEELPQFSVGDIPYYATEDMEMEIPLPEQYRGQLYIGLKTEKEWLHIAFSNERAGIACLTNHVASYRKRYGLSFTNAQKYDQDRDIAVIFLEQHGICSAGLVCKMIGDVVFADSRARQAKYIAEREKANRKGCALYFFAALPILIGALYFIIITTEGGGDEAFSFGWCLGAFCFLLVLGGIHTLICIAQGKPPGSKL